jgi:ABC-type branched-subunit amino acid transport system ATPase component
MLFRPIWGIDFMLKVKNLHTYYGRIRALNNVSLHVRAGEIVCLIGANGAGKTTILNTVSGLIPSARGEIYFEDGKMKGLPPEKIVAAGISQVPEGREVFGPLTVLENLQLGAYPWRTCNWEPICALGRKKERPSKRIWNGFSNSSLG